MDLEKKSNNETVLRENYFTSDCNNIIATSSLFLGLFSTMPIVGIHFGSRDVSFYRLLFLFTIAYMAIEVVARGHGKIQIGRNTKRIDIWLLEAAFGCLCGGIFLSNSAPQFANAAISSLRRVLPMLLFAILWSSGNKKTKLNEAIARGFLLGCFANCIWAIVDAFGYYLTGRSLNNVVFAGYIARRGIRYHSLSLAYSSGLFRASGFNSDPAQLGLMAPIIACYGICKKKYWIVVIAFGAVLASASTTGLVCTAIVIILNIFRNKKKQSIKPKTILLYAFILAVVAFFIVRYWSQTSSIVSTQYHLFSGRIIDSYASEDSQTIRWQYILYLPLAIINVIPFLLFGSGFGTASLGYTRSDMILNAIGTVHNFAYDMENTYIAYLLDTGIIGFILFVLLMRCMIKGYNLRLKSKSADEFSVIVWCMLCSSVFSMFFYHYILFAPQMLMFTIACSSLDQDTSNS